MKQYFIYILMFMTTLATITTLILASAIRHRGPHTMTEWFYSTNAQKVAYFQAMGTNSFSFLEGKLQGSTVDRQTACSLVTVAFNKTQIDNSEIKSGIISMLKSGIDPEEVLAYMAIQRLDLTVPQSFIMDAAQTCPYIRVSMIEDARGPKLARLRGMSPRSIDCSFVANLCDDPDPEVQMEAISFLLKCDRVNTNGDICANEIVPAMASLLTNTTDSSVLSIALAYMSDTPEHMRENMPAVCDFLCSTAKSSLQMDCLAVMAAYTRYGPLPAEAYLSLKSLQARSDLSQMNRWEVDNLLNDHR